MLRLKKTEHLLVPLLLLLLIQPSNTQSAATDRDGFSDHQELQDPVNRERFRRWFTVIAASQFYYQHPRWPKVRRDCAGLICFAYQEAFKPHTNQWFTGYKYLTDTNIPDINPSPPGPDYFLAPADPHGTELKKFPAVSARLLMQYNSRRISSELDDTVEPGDLLFFRYRNENQLEDQYHAMILLNLHRTPDGQWDGDVVYHTGPDGDTPGEVRKVSISQLNNHPDDTWSVKPHNPHFLGFFRFHILGRQPIDTAFIKNKNQSNQKVKP